MTLRSLCEERGMNITEVAGKSGISLTTMYRMMRKEKVHRNNIRSVCATLGITEKEYGKLEPEK